MQPEIAEIFFFSISNIVKIVYYLAHDPLQSLQFNHIYLTKSDKILSHLKFTHNRHYRSECETNNVTNVFFFCSFGSDLLS